MPGAPLKLTLFSLLLAFAWPSAARADDDGLSGSYDMANPAPGGEIPAAQPPLDGTTAPEAAPADEAEAPTPAVPAYSPPKPSLRFKLEERSRLISWLSSLCGEEPVATEDSTRVRYKRDKSRTYVRATNKQGSLLLLLQNYAELTQFRDDCEKRRKSNPDACVQHGRLPKPWEVKDTTGANAWLTVGSSQFWQDIQTNRTPAGIEARTDLLAASKERVNTLQLTLLKNFYEFRDASELGGLPGTAAKARQLTTMISQEWHCGPSATAEGPERPRSAVAPKAERSPAAQK